MHNSLTIIKGLSVSDKTLRLARYAQSYIRKTAFCEINPKRLFFLVPEQFTFDTERRLYKILGAQEYNKIEAESFSTLSQKIFLECGVGRRDYPDENTAVLLLYQAVEECKDSLLALRKKSDKLSFLTEISEVIRELSIGGIGADKLVSKNKYLSSETLKINGGGRLSEKLTDISIIYSEYEKLLSKHGFELTSTSVSSAAKLANMNSFFRDAAVFCDEFDSFTAPQIEMLNAVLESCGDTGSRGAKLYVTTPLSDSDNRGMFKSVRKSIDTLIEKAAGLNLSVHSENAEYYPFFPYALEHIRKYSFGNCFAPFDELKNSDCVKIAEAADVYDEAEYVAAAIARLIREGYNSSEIAVVTRRASNSAVIFCEAFKRYAIPFFADMPKPITKTAPVRLFSSVLKLVSFGANGFSTADLLDYAKNILSGFGFADICLLEDYCFKWDVDGELWTKEFTFAENFSNEEKLLKETAKLEYVEALRKTVAEPILTLRNSCCGVSAEKICVNLLDFFYENGIEEKLAETALEFGKNGDLNAEAEIKTAWNALCDFLQSIAENIGDMELPPKRFYELFVKTIADVNFNVPPVLAEAVTLADAGRTKLDVKKVMFLVGANEGVFPAAYTENMLMLSREKSILAEFGFEIGKTASEYIADENRNVFRFLVNAVERLYITYPIADVVGAELAPAEFVTTLKNAFGGFEKSPFLRTAELGADFFCLTPNAAYRYYIIRRANEKTDEIFTVKKALENIPEFNLRLKNLYNAKKIVFKIDGGDTISQVFGDKLILSPTAFEQFIKCGFAFFCQNGLRIYPREKKDFDSFAEGNFSHFCLEKIFKDFADFSEADENAFRQKIGEYKETFYRDTYCAGLPNEDKIRFSLDALAENTADVLLYMSRKLAESDFAPTEWEMNIPSQNNGVAFQTAVEVNGEKRAVSIRGKIDRVDVCEKDGVKYIRIIDYKSSEKNISAEKLFYGLDMQMLFYLYSLTRGGAKFDGASPAGVFYMNSGQIPPSEYVPRLKAEDARLESDKKRLLFGFAARDVSQDDVAPKAVSLSGEGFRKLEDHVLGRFSKSACDIYNGKFNAIPLMISSKLDSCKYCEYKDVCGNFPPLAKKPIFDDVKEIMNDILNDI